MPPARSAEIDLPTIDDLGRDLLVTTPLQRWIALTRPFLGLAAFMVSVRLGWWLLAPLLVFLIFVAIVTVTHDVVHGALGLSRRQSDWALFVFGAVLFESGHAYRQTHRRHHSVFPGPDDPEGDPARMRLWRAILYGPFFLPRLWWWALQRTRDNRREQMWLIAEGLWAAGGLVAAVVLWPWVPSLTLYVALAIVGSWVYPLLTVHLPHRNYGDTPLTQTHTLRGWIVPKVFLELTYHLEHHLYPQVPSHHLARLSQRLDPFFRRAGIRPRRVP